MAGTIGVIISVDAVEAVNNTHFAHAYVRGRWSREEKSTSMLLAKSSHDLDIIQWLLDKPCKRVQSFGSLTHFVPEQAPQGAPIRWPRKNVPSGTYAPTTVCGSMWKPKRITTVPESLWVTVSTTSLRMKRSWRHCVTKITAFACTMPTMI